MMLVLINTSKSKNGHRGGLLSASHSAVVGKSVVLGLFKKESSLFVKKKDRPLFSAGGLFSFAPGIPVCYLCQIIEIGSIGKR